MKLPPLTKEQWDKAFSNTKKPEVMDRQNLPVRYAVEDPVVEGRPRRFLETFAAILRHTNYQAILEQYIRVCAKCARCSTVCQIYAATGDSRDVPYKRSELLLNVYRRHFTASGMLRGRILGAPGLTDDDIREMAESFWNCTACRRCSMECPFGIDHGLVTHLGRYILSEIGVVPRALAVSVRAQLEGGTHNTSAIPLPAIQDTLEFLEDEMREEKGVSIKFPVDQEGADYLFLAPVSDFIMEAETLMGIATVMTTAGESWTIGSRIYDAINYGLFYNDHVLERVLNEVRIEAERLKVKAILIGECGHASRTARFFYPTFCGGKDALPVYNIIEITHRALMEGRLKLDPTIITQKVTYHDPCNYARSGWIVEQPREILKAFCPHYIEMSYPGKGNICCGGGGGAAPIDEFFTYRMEIGGRAKAQQIIDTGADIIVAPCANCKKQIKELINYHKIKIELMGLHEMIYKAIVLPESLESVKKETESKEA